MKKLVASVLLLLFPVSLCVELCVQYDKSCLQENCQRSIPCYHGFCDVAGKCVCDACYHGDSCDVYVDKYMPSFYSTEDEVYIEDPWVATPVYHAQAFDNDYDSTCARNEVRCDCSLIFYYLVDEKEFFSINNVTGEVYIKEPVGLLSVGIYTILVEAKGLNHEWDTASGVIQVTFYLSNDIWTDQEQITKNVMKNASNVPLIRQKREDSVNNQMTSFELSKIEGEEEKMEIGKTVCYSLAIKVPKTEKLDVIVEIFTKQINNNSYLPTFALCKVQIKPSGDAISYSQEKPHIRMILSDHINTVYDRAVIDFGYISNTADESQLEVTFCIAQIRNLDTTYNQKHFVTAGAEYDQENYVWVGQAEVIPNEVEKSADVPEIVTEVTGPTEIALDSAGVYYLDSWISIRSSNVTVEVQLNDTETILTVGHLGVMQFGEYYVCVPQDIYYYNASYTGSEKTCLNTKAKLELGLVTNIGPLDKQIKDDGNKIRFTFAVYAPNIPSNIGKKVDISAGILIGEEKVWSSIISVTIKEREDEPRPKLHAVDTKIYPKEDQTAAVGSLMSYILLTTLDGVGGYFNYVIKVVVPKEGGKIQMEPCGARLLKAVDSFNVPYVPCDVDIEPEYDGDQTFLIKLNRLHVTDQHSPAKSNDSLIMSELIVKISTHDHSVSGSKLQMTVSVESSKDFIDVPVGQVEIIETKSQPVPSVEIKNAVSWELLHEGGAIAFDVVVTITPSIGYGDLFFEAAGDEDSILQICMIELTDVGSHLPCLGMHRDDVNRNITYSLVNSESTCLKSNRAAMKVGDVGAVNRDKQGDRNAFVIKVVASLPTCSEFDDETDYELTVGLTIGTRSMWASEVKYTSTIQTSTIPEEKKPFVNVDVTSEGVAPGYPVEVVITINTAPDSIGQYKIILRAEEEDSSVCILRVKAAGKNMPCVEFETPSIYIPHTNKDKGIKEAKIQFSALSNIGTSESNQTSEENALQLQAMVKLSKQAKNDQELNWKVDYGSGEANGEITIPLKTDSVPQMYGDDPRAANLTLTPSIEAAIGAPQFVTLDLELNEFFLAPITVKIMNPDSSKHPYDVCLAGITTIGVNYPCLAPSTVVTQIPASESNYKDSADIRLGTVCNSYIDRENFSANLIQLKVALYLKQEVNVGDDIRVAIQIVLGNRTITNLPQLSSKAVKSIEDVNPPDEVVVKPSDGENIPIKVRQRVWVTYEITIPPHSIMKVSVRVKAPIKERRAVFTLHQLRLVSGGKNLPCPLASGEVEYRLLSNVPTAQNDTIEADLGYFGNLGVTHVNNAEGEEDDDKLKIEVLVELADHPESEHGSVHMVDCIAIINGVEGKAQQPFVIERTGEEKADLTAEVIVDDSKTFQSGDVIQMYAYLKHSNVSLAEPYDITLRLYIPPYVVFNTETSWNPIKLTIKNESGGLDIVFPLLTFPDEVEVNFTVLADPHKQRKHGKGVITATTPYRILCRQTLRSQPVQNPPKDGLFDCSQMSHLLYKINSAACNDKLGLDDPAIIENCQFTASSAASKEWAPYYARVVTGGKDTGKAWSPPVRTGPCQHYLQVDFLRNVRVGSVVLQRIDGLRHVTEFKFLYSKSGIDWILAIQATTNYQDDLSTTELTMPVVGRFFRLVVLKNNDPTDLSKNVGVRMELYGCVVDKDIFVRCGSDDTWYTDDLKKVGRHMVLDTELERIYFCDARDDPNKKMCYSSDDGISWNILPWNIGSLLGYDSETRLVYAVDDRNWAYMATNDSLHWTFVKKTDMGNIRGRNSFKSRVNIPSVTQKELGTVSAGKWKATVDSLNYEGHARVKWDLCCST
ncbi:uncharacterized protein LOC111623972 isoform X2 [Centruroides sculpturatus]|uniref:uncharacterized protein LOC111623972 isoform X2 n=1 Tax=Centruroides sculpturatus TaxID=218467 RepID=UPI000C6E63A3|nr:uncharacterized protein LOC111623972 isoform X2 [Centruroides sculpturatus]